MGLTVAGHCQQARAAYQWLADHQEEDGSWCACYFEQDQQGDQPDRIETNFVAYPATGIWHYYLVTGDRDFVRRYFPMIERATTFVLRQQSVEGDIQWAVSSQKPLAKDALVTACSSILRSLECALHLAQIMRNPKPHWLAAYRRLAEALMNKPWRFDRTWESKARYSMDWFYPILAGIYTRPEAQKRLQQNWQKFVEPGQGCRCVSDEPWMTVAETCELVMALQAAGQSEKAAELLRWIGKWQDRDGGFWTGYNFRDQVIWPPEKTSWTAAAVLLAADAVLQLTPAARLFTTSSPFYSGSPRRSRMTSD